MGMPTQVATRRAFIGTSAAALLTANLLLWLLLTVLAATPPAAASSRWHHTPTSRPFTIDAIKRRQALRQHIQLLLQKCPVPGYCVRDAGLPTAAEYLTEPEDWDMKQQKQKVAEFIAGPGFKARVQQLQSSLDERGILISAGKPHHVGTMTIMLHVLRHQYNCSLPVEVAYRGDSEVDPTTRHTLSTAFPPLYWLDLKQQQYPTHHNQEAVFDRYEPKIYALYHTRFTQVLLLDADNLPLRDPTHLFTSPHMTTAGVMMWLDLWSPTLSSTTFIGHDTVYPLVGLRKQPYWVTLSAGSGHVSRVTESGQLLLDRVRHADVLEYLWWINSYSSVVYRHILGDKDTFGYAFAAAGKLHEYSAVAVPPGAAFRLKQQQQQQQDKQAPAGKVWRFMGMLQYDHLGSPAFFHRTFEKWEDVLSPPQHIDVVTGPLPNWFIMSYLGNKTTGLTPEIPPHTLWPAHVTTCSSSSSSDSAMSTYLDNASNYARAVNAADDVRLGACPIQMYLDHLRLRDWGLPVSKQQWLLRACHRVAAGSRSRMDYDSTPSSSSSSRNGSISWWPWLSEQSWFRNCRAHRQQQHVGSKERSSRYSSDSIDKGHDDDDARFITDRKMQQAQPRPPGSPAAAVASDAITRSVRVAGSTHQLPRCDLVDWHVARFSLPEYAEEVGKDTAGQPVPQADPQLPVLQLLPPKTAEAVEGSGIKAAGQVPHRPTTENAVQSQGLLPSSAGRTVGHYECQGSEHSSVLDEVQQQAIPAAMHWVRDNLKHLSMLDKDQ